MALTLGSIQTRAERDGDEYVINGSKIWTTMGNYAKYMILLARTDSQAERRYNGLSFFLAPMGAEGNYHLTDPEANRRLRLYRDVFH
jgi:alkylation response protein AidB-like acyl-CoA dehydrogenase